MADSQEPTAKRAKTTSTPASAECTCDKILMPAELVGIIASHVPHEIYIVTSTLHHDPNYSGYRETSSFQTVGAFDTISTANNAARKYHSLKVEEMARTATEIYEDRQGCKCPLTTGWETQQPIKDDGTIELWTTSDQDNGWTCITEIEVQSVTKDLSTWSRDDMKPVCDFIKSGIGEDVLCRCCNDIKTEEVRNDLRCAE